MIKKLLLLLALTTICSCVNNSKKTSNDCLVGHDWCVPNCKNPQMVLKFLSDGTFNFTTNLFGGNGAQGTWEDVGEQQIQLNYTKSISNIDVPNKIITMSDCGTLKLGKTLYKK